MYSTYIGIKRSVKSFHSPLHALGLIQCYLFTICKMTNDMRSKLFGDKDSHSKKNWMIMDIAHWLSFFPFLDWSGRFYPVELSSLRLVDKFVMNIVLHSLRKGQQMTVAYSVLFFDKDFTCWNYLYEPYIQPGILVQWASSFLIIYVPLIWQGISCATPWKTVDSTSEER